MDMVQIATARILRSKLVGLGRGREADRKKPFIADQRGAVALETLIVYPVLVAFVLMSLAEVAIAGFQFASALAALRSFGQYIQYSPPNDVTNASSWASNALAKSGPSYPVSNLQVMCGDAIAVCNSGNVTQIPKYFTFTTTVTLAPIVWRPVLCSPSCTYTLRYSERFQ